MTVAIFFTLEIFYLRTLFSLSYNRYIHNDVSIHCLRTTSDRQSRNMLITSLTLFSLNM